LENASEPKLGQINALRLCDLARMHHGFDRIADRIEDAFALRKHQIRLPYVRLQGCPEREEDMTILEQIEQRSSALKVNELAEMLQVTPQHIYRMASSGLIPCFRIEGAIRLDPKEIVNWLRSKQPQAVRTRRLRAA
jgi:predicted DNA-binding transcriptional regulator AlpA